MNQTPVADRVRYCIVIDVAETPGRGFYATVEGHRTWRTEKSAKAVAASLDPKLHAVVEHAPKPLGRVYWDD